GVRPIAPRVSRPGRVRGARVPVRNQPSGEHGTGRYVQLESCRAGAKPLARVACREEDREAGRHGDSRLTTPDELIAVVDGDVAQACPPTRLSLHALPGNRVTELVRLPRHGPFLREGRDPGAAAQAL